MADDLFDGLDDLFDDDDISNLLSSTDTNSTATLPSQNTQQPSTQTSQQIPLPRPSSSILNHQPINVPTVITSNMRTSSTTIPMPQQQHQQPFNNAFNNRSSQPFINFHGMNPSHNVINPNSQMHSKPTMTQQEYLNLMRNPNQNYTPPNTSSNNNFMRMNTLPLNLPNINNNSNNSNNVANNPYLMQVANFNKQQQLVKGFISSQQPQGKYSSSATTQVAPPKPSVPLHSVINQMGGNPKLGFSTIINPPPTSAAGNAKLALSFLNSIQQLNTPTGGVIPPTFFTSAPTAPVQITLPTSTKGFLEISAGTKLGKKWPKLLSEIPKVEITVVNNRIWQSLVLSPNSNVENNSIRCYVPDFGSEFDDFDDDDLDDEEDDMLTDDEEFNNMDEESFDLNKFNSKTKKSQGMKRTRSGERPRQKGNACVYLFSPNREAFGYISSQEYNNCFVPLSKHKVIMITVSPLPSTDNSGRFFVSLKVYLVKKALVTDKNILESNNDSNDSNNNILATTVDGLADEQIRIYNIRKNFLKKLFEILDRNNCSTSSSSTDLADYDSSKVRKTSESDLNASRLKQEEDDDLDALDDTDLDEYIIQKAPSSSNASSSNQETPGTDKSLERQLEELYDEIEKTIVDDENAENDFSDEEESSHHEIEIPDDTLLTADLRSYQKTAVKWMLKRERIGEDKVKTTPKLHSLYQERKFPDGTAFYFNPLNGIITLTFVPAPPEPKGGILADEMGLGKTVEVIGLIASNRMKGKKNAQKVGDKYQSPATLVVTPLTIVDQWKQEIEKHTNNQLSVYVYQGSRRIRDAPTLLKYDVIITTYNTLSFEFSQTYTPTKERSNAKKKQTKDTSLQQPSPIYKMKFFRVVLDEAHNIKNRKSLQARATAAVDAERRWAVTGTPIQNHIDDLFSLFHFLKVNPHGDWRWWSRFIGKPFEKKDKKAIEALQSVIKKLVIRRTKNKKINGKRIVMLPPKRVETVTIQFTEAESNFYKSLYEYSKGKFNEFVRSGTVLKNYANILEMLLHLRQVCNHPALIITSFQKKSEKSTMNGFLESFEQKNAFEVYDSILPMLPQVLKLNKEKNRPKQNLEDAMISSQLKAINVTKYMRTNWRSSSKIGALIEKLRVLELGTKSVVFSQWTSMLDLVEVALEKSNIRFVRLDGKMQRKDRDDAVQKFKFDPHIQVCLISLKVGGTGLNLVWATHVFLLDPWWNPAIEEQAIDRVHRIGQDKPVTVFRFVVKDSVEERILSLQKSKTKIANEALNLGGSDDEEEENYTTYTTSFLGGSFGGGALKSKSYDSDEEVEDDEEDEFNEVTVDDLEDEESGSGGAMFGHTKKDAQKIRIKDLSTIFV